MGIFNFNAYNIKKTNKEDVPTLEKSEALLAKQKEKEKLVEEAPKQEKSIYTNDGYPRIVIYEFRKLISEKGGQKDFKGFPLELQKDLNELMDKFFPKTNQYVKKEDVRHCITKLNEELQCSRPETYKRAVRVFKEELSKIK